MERPGTATAAYEDYQRDIERFNTKQDDCIKFQRVKSDPVLASEVRVDELRSSHLTHIGGFRRWFLHTSKSKSADPTSCGDEGLLAEQIEEQMRHVSFFLGHVENARTESGKLSAPFDDGHSTPLLSTAAAAKPKKLLSVPKACLSTFKAFIATGILFMPQAVTNAGWAWALVLMACSAVTSTAGILLLGQCHHACMLSYPLLGERAFGIWGYWLIAGQVAISQFGFVTSYFIFITKTLNHIFISCGLRPLPVGCTLLLLALLLTPLGWIRRIGKMKMVNVVGDVIICLAVAAVAIAATHRLHVQGIAPEVVAIAPPEKVLVFAGTAVYAFEGIALVIPIRESMEKPELFAYMLVGMMILFMVLLTSFGILGYLAWGTAVQTIVLNELSGPAASIIQSLYIIAIICTFPIAIYPCFSICENALFSHMRQATIRKWSKNMFRATVTFAMAALAYFMAAELALFISILGSFCSIPLAIIFPAMLHLKLVGGAALMSWALIVIGCCLIPLTLYVDFLSWGEAN